VTGSEDEPLVGARVETVGFGGGEAPVLTDAEGRYPLRGASGGMGMGVAMVRVRVPGYVQDAERLMVSGKPDEQGRIVHDVKMRRAGVVTGRVVSPEGKPVGGATITLKAASAGGMEVMGGFLGREQTFTLSDGTFVFDGAEAGADARVSAALTGWVSATSEPFAVKGGETVKAPDLVLHRGATLVVRVVGADGRPAVAARVQGEVTREGATAADFDFTSMMESDYDLATDDAGLARLEHLPKGQVTVTVAAKGQAGARATAEVSGEDGAETVVEVSLQRARPVSGTVADVDGRPIAQARVEVQGDGSAWVAPLSVQTDSKGDFRIDEAPEAGISLAVRAKGFQQRIHPVGPQREGIAISLVREDPDRARRRDAVQQELMGLYTKLTEAKDDTERTALAQRVRELTLELQELGGTAVSDLTDVEPAPAPPLEDDR
jgi:hypothetical protein